MNRPLAPPMMKSPSDDLQRPRVTVAAVIERNQRFLLVEERDDRGHLVINQPAGHLERDESVSDGLIREVLEETAWQVRPVALVGIYTWSRSPESPCFLRIALEAEALNEVPGRALDFGIERAIWLTRDEVAARAPQLRSPLVLRCIDDFIAGSRFSLDVFIDKGH